MYDAETDETTSTRAEGLQESTEGITEGNGDYSTTLEPPMVSGRPQERPPLDVAEDRFHSLLNKHSQSRKTKQQREPRTQLGSATTVSSSKKNVNGKASGSERTRKTGGYGTVPLPPAASLVLLARDPTPSLDQKAAATGVVSGVVDQKTAATGNGYRPRTLFHQQVCYFVLFCLLVLSLLGSARFPLGTAILDWSVPRQRCSFVQPSKTLEESG